MKANFLSEQQEGVTEDKVSASTAAKDEVASEITDTREHIQSQVRSRPGKKSQQKSRKKNLIVREKDERLHTTTTFMAENKSYQLDDFQFNSLKFGEIVALMYSARKVSREMQTINKVKIPHMLLEDMKWTVRRAEAQPVVKLVVINILSLLLHFIVLYSSDIIQYIIKR